MTQEELTAIVEGITNAMSEGVDERLKPMLARLDALENDVRRDATSEMLDALGRSLSETRR